MQSVVVNLNGILLLLRRGEYLFNHAAISFQKQLSCNTCHPENHVDGLIYDIAVDGAANDLTKQQLNDLIEYLKAL